MTVAGFPISEDEKVNVLLKGLPTSADCSQINITVLQDPDPKFDWLIHLLRGHELQLMRRENLSSATALHTNSKFSSKTAGSGSGSGRPAVKCTNCKRTGHTVQKCF